MKSGAESKCKRKSSASKPAAAGDRGVGGWLLYLGCRGRGREGGGLRFGRCQKRSVETPRWRRQRGVFSNTYSKHLRNAYLVSLALFVSLSRQSSFPKPETTSPATSPPYPRPAPRARLSRAPPRRLAIRCARRLLFFSGRKTPQCLSHPFPTPARHNSRR